MSMGIPEQHSQMTPLQVYFYKRQSYLLSFSLSLCVHLIIELRSVTDILENAQTAICVHRMISSYKPHTVTEYFNSEPKMGVYDQ